MFIPRSRVLVAAALATCGACSTLLPPVRVSGSPQALVSMAGEWRGEYASPLNGRSGSILFRLDATADSAFGDVVMVPRPQYVALGATAPDQSVRSAVPTSSLSIRFVRINEGRVSGVLEPYLDPDCVCLVTTTFEGAARGDRVRGTFRTQGPFGVVGGTWQATRVRR